jgi:peptide/nickel transport system substrate-binding protein
MSSMPSTGSDSLHTLAHEVLSARIGRREFLQRATALGLSASAAGAFLAACGSSPQSSTKAPPPSSAKKGGTLVVGPFGDSQNYDPATNNADYPEIPFPSIYEGLTAYVPSAPAGSPAQNLLAESIEKSADGRKYYFKLKQGVEFHHGYGEVTAADVKYSWERDAGLIKLYPGAPKSDTTYYGGDFPGLEEVKVTGKYTGIAIFKEPFVPFETITLPWTTSGYVFPQKAVDKYGSSWPRNPVGTGPYEVVSYTPSSEMVLQRFSGYSGANVKLGARNWFDEIRITMTALNAVPKGEALTVALQSGEVDFTPVLGALDVRRLKGNSAFRTYSPIAPLDYYFIALDVQNPKLKDVRVRQAIRYAINIPEIIAANLLPASSRLPSLVAKQMGVGYWAGAPVYTRDVAKAKSLLAAAGAKNLTLELATPSIATQPGEPNNVMQVIKSNLAEAGITVDIIETPPNSYVAKAGFGQLMWTYYGGAPDPYYQFEWFQCSQIGVWNYSSWCDKQYSGLLPKLGQTSNVAQRDAISIEMQKLIDDAASYIWISTAVNFAASKSDTVAVFDRNANPLMHYFYRT